MADTRSIEIKNCHHPRGKVKTLVVIGSDHYEGALQRGLLPGGDDYCISASNFDTERFGEIGAIMDLTIRDSGTETTDPNGDTISVFCNALICRYRQPPTE